MSNEDKDGMEGVLGDLLKRVGDISKRVGNISPGGALDGLTGGFDLASLMKQEDNLKLSQLIVSIGEILEQSSSLSAKLTIEQVSALKAARADLVSELVNKLSKK